MIDIPTPDFHIDASRLTEAGYEDGDIVPELCSRATVAVFREARNTWSGTIPAMIEFVPKDTPPSWPDELEDW